MGHLHSSGTTKMEEKSKQSVFSKLLNIFVLHAEEVKQQELVSCYQDTSNKILVGGGTGFIGTELCKTLKNKGYNPIIVSRSPGQSRVTYANLESNGLPLNTKAVVNLAGQNVFGYFPPRDDGFVYNEDSTVEESKRDFFSKLVVDWENAARLAPDTGVRNVFLRPGVVLGRNGGMIKQIFLPFFIG